MLEVREWLEKMQFHYLWGTKQLMDKIGGWLKYSVIFFVCTAEKKSSCDHKLLTMKKKEKLGTVKKERYQTKLLIISGP